MPTSVKIIIGFVILAGIAYAADMVMLKQKESKLIETEYDFRNANWGMSPDEVEASESLALDFGWYDNYLFFETVKVGDYEAYVTYLFKDNKLIHGYYQFTQEDINPNLNNEDVNKIKEFFVSKYGPENEDFSFDYLAEKIRTVEWETQDSYITLTVLDNTGETESDMDFEVDIVYMDKDSVSTLSIMLEAFSILFSGLKESLSKVFN